MTELDPIAGDLYEMQDLLTGDEREIVGRVRDFLAAEVAPIANGCWARAEFPYHLISRYGDLSIAGLPYDECPGDRPRGLLSGFLAMEMARVDPSMATFYGVHAGLAMGSIAHCGSKEQRLRWLPGMAAAPTSPWGCAPPPAARGTNGC
jgi:glutaryl-CoA dehydrogenase